MEELEDSTLDLIYRRGVRPLSPAYVVILVAAASLAALPLIRVSRVVNARGIIRSAADPAGICAPVTGIIDSTILVDNLVVAPGDTVAWIRQDIPGARIREYETMILNNLKFMADIRQILSGSKPCSTSRFIQSHRHHETALSYLQLQLDFLEEECNVSEELYQEEVIPFREHARMLNDLQLARARRDDLDQQYKNSLEKELAGLEMENNRHESEISLIRASLSGYCLIAPLGGSVQNCSGISSGTVVNAGVPLAAISPSGMLTAECYLETGNIPLVRPGTSVRLTFDGPRTRHLKSLDTLVEQVDDDVIMMEGVPLLRVRCTVEGAFIKKGMTFTASFLLEKESLASVILEKADLRFNPSRTARTWP